MSGVMDIPGGAEAEAATGRVQSLSYRLFALGLAAGLLVGAPPGGLPAGLRVGRGLDCTWLGSMQGCMDDGRGTGAGPHLPSSHTGSPPVSAPSERAEALARQGFTVTANSWRASMAEAAAAAVRGKGAPGLRGGTNGSDSPVAPVFPPPPPLIFVTAARTHAGDGPTEIRELEYAMGLSYLTSKGFRTAVVISESDASPQGELTGGGGEDGVQSQTHRPWPLLDSFRWDNALYFTPDKARHRGKSAREGACMKRLVELLDRHHSRHTSLPSSFAFSPQPRMHPDSFVFKASGRYQVVRDELFHEVLRGEMGWAAEGGDGGGGAPRSGEDLGPYDLVARYDPDYDQIFTFWFAMRWRHFRAFHLAVDLEQLETTSIEILILRYARDEGLRIRFIPRLFVIANINNSGKTQLM